MKEIQNDPNFPDGTGKESEKDILAKQAAMIEELRAELGRKAHLEDELAKAKKEKEKERKERKRLQELQKAPRQPLALDPEQVATAVSQAVQSMEERLQRKLIEAVSDKMSALFRKCCSGDSSRSQYVEEWVNSIPK